MNFVIKRSLVSNLLIHIYLVLLFSYNVFFNINILLVLLGVIGTILFFFYIGDFFYYLNNKIIFFSIFYLLISGYVTNLFYSLTLGRVAVVLQILASIGLAVFFAKEKFSERIFLFYLILFFIFICYKIFYVQLDTNDIFQHSSKNAISTVALIYTVQYYSLAIKNRVPIRLYPSIFCLFLCVVGIGRTGIFVSFCLFLYILIKNIEFSKFYRIIIFLFIIICFMIFLHYKKTILAIFDLYKIAKRNDIGNNGLLYSERFSLWKEYIVNLKWFEWLIGKDILQYRGRVFLRLNGNLHNSFFLIHARCGLSGPMFLVYVLILILKRKNTCQEKMFSVLLAFILIRGMFDIVFFFNPNDFVVMGILFLLITKSSPKYKFDILRHRRIQ